MEKTMVLHETMITQRLSADEFSLQEGLTLIPVGDLDTGFPPPFLVFGEDDDDDDAEDDLEEEEDFDDMEDDFEDDFEDDDFEDEEDDYEDEDDDYDYEEDVDYDDFEE
jgi:hypothetical protein